MEDNTNDTIQPAGSDTAERNGRRHPIRLAARSATSIYDLLLRKSAEFDNYRKRVERERQTLSDAAAAEHDRRTAAARSTISSAR